MGKKSSKRTEYVLFNVTYEDGSEETVALGQIVAWSAMGASTPAPYRCP